MASNSTLLTPDEEYHFIQIIKKLNHIERQIDSCNNNPERYRNVLDILYDLKAKTMNELKAITQKL